MTNKEYVIQNHLDDIIEALTELGSCVLCGKIGCAEYCKSKNAPYSCEETFEAWLNMEHVEPLLFPIGTIVEIKFSDGSKTVGYYNGVYDGKHYVTLVSTNIGKRTNNKPFGDRYNEAQLKKVGD